MTSSQNLAWESLHQKQEVFKDKIEQKPQFIDSYFFIYDCIDNTMLFTNTGFETITGYESKMFDINFLISMIHPDDLSYFFKCEEKGLEFTNRLLFSEHFQYVFHYAYRIVTKSGDIINIQQQCQAIEVNDQGHLSKTLVVHKKISDDEYESDNNYRIFDKRLNSFVNAENYFNLTKREIEIANLVKDGISSPEIARRLNISKLTVDTHRKKILAKSNCSNFLELFKRTSVFEIL